MLGISLEVTNPKGVCAGKYPGCPARWECLELGSLPTDAHPSCLDLSAGGGSSERRQSEADG